MTMKVGVEVDAWCTKCRMDLSHLVVALLEGKPKRVECQTCHTQHNYRKPKGATEPVPRETAEETKTDSEPTPKKKPVRVTKARAEYLAEWEAHVAGHEESEFTKYSIKHEFQEEELLTHKKFGLGFVAEVLDDKKISVMFEDTARTLIHARP